MSIVVRCVSCKAAFKASDNLAGRKVKCPRCGQVVPVPASEAVLAVGEQSSRPGIRAGLPSRTEKPARSMRLPLRTFEELKVPARLCRSIEEEVGDEEMLWLDRPSPQSLLGKAKIGMLAGVIVSVLTGIAVYIALENVEGATAELIVWGVAGMVALTMGLPMLTMPIWVRWLINYRDCYVLTPTRAIVFDNEKIFRAVAMSYTADRLEKRSLRVNDDGSGSIIFGNQVIDLGLRQRRRTKQREGSRGEKVRVTTTTTWREKANKRVGFLDIEDVEKVEALLRQVLQLGPPASKDVD